MIPKIIHYCWFGGKEKTKSAKKCIASWKKFCPDWEIIEWNEENFDVSKYEYTRYCYENKKWAFLSDMVRLIVVAENGGIYFDTDVEMIHSFEALTNYEAFYSFEDDKNINTGQGFGAKAGHTTVLAMLDEYLKQKPNNDGSYPMIKCPELNTKALTQFGLVLDGSRQNIVGAEILPIDYMNPYDNPTGRLNKTKNTISIHWYSKSWMDKKTIFRSKLTQPLHRIFGKDCFERMKRSKE